MLTKRFFQFFILGIFGLSLGSSVIFAQSEDNQLIDIVEEETNAALEELQDTLEFKQFNSCADMNSILTDFIKKFDNYGPVYRGGVVPIPMVDMAMEESTVTSTMTKSVMPGTNSTDGDVLSSSDEFSTTNLQKKNIEEPEIIKTDGKHIFYFNQQEHKIYILKSPLDISSSTINMDNAEIKTVVNLPDRFNGIQLFVEEDRMVILGTRYVNIKRDSLINRSQRTSLAIYDTSDIKNLKLLKFTDLDGYYRESRMINNKLYIISEMNVNWYWGRDIMDSSTSSEGLEIQGEDVVPRAIDVVDGKLDVVTPDCENVSYIFPSDETIENSNLYPVFTLVSVVDVQNTDNTTETNVLLSTAGAMHMTEDSLYIAQNLRVSQRSTCPLGARCIMPQFDNGQYSLIHKFDVNGFDLGYETSNLVPGSLLNQYSMDEDNDGNFRLFTRGNRRDGTNFYALDNELELRGKIEKIAEGEQFKSSRMIGDKAYLVTFEQTDPLFAIDLADIDNPEIVGELKIPGFSTYLHPLGEMKDNVQYLIGLGYEANENGRQEGLQLSMYEVAYDESETKESRCGWLNESVFEEEYKECLTEVSVDNIKVSQISNVTIGGKGSMSEAMTNPRMFVMDRDSNVTLPMILQDEINGGERCDVFRDENGVEVKSDCYPITRQETSFAGLKSFNFDVNNKTIKEKYSINYLSLFEKLYSNEKDEYYGFNARQIRGTHMRVGFAGDALYMVNNDFSHFYLPTNGDGKYLYFDEELE